MTVFFLHICVLSWTSNFKDSWKDSLSKIRISSIQFPRYSVRSLSGPRKYPTFHQRLVFFFFFLNIFSVKNGENIPEMSFIQEVGDESLGHVGNLWKVMTGFSCKNHGPLVFKLRLWCKYSVLNTDTQVKLQFYNKTNKIQP